MQASEVFSATFHALKSATRSVFFLCTGFVLAMNAANAAQLAMVADVQGKVVAQRAGVTLPVDILMALAGGEDISLEAGSRMTVVYLGSGDEFEATGPGKLTLGETQLLARPGSGAKIARRASPLAGATGQFAAAGGVIQGAVRMRSLGNPPIRLTGPQGKLLRPPAVFAWETAAQPSSAYGFELIEEGPSGPGTLLTLETQDRQIAPPKNIAWASDRAYRWSLSFVDAGGQRRKVEAGFQIAGPAESGQWQRWRPPTDAPLSDWVVYAGLLKEANFLTDARMVWAELARKRPESVELQTLSRP